MAKQTRGPGGGRKPRNHTGKMTAHFTMRMGQELRQALERESARANRSMSEHAEKLLWRALQEPERTRRDWNGDHNYGLARLIARAVWSVEVSTGICNPIQPSGKTWRDDPFTAAAVHAAIDILIRNLTPPSSGKPKPPPEVQRGAEWQKQMFPAEQAAFYQTPEGVGSVTAMSLLEQLRTYDRPPFNHPANEHYADIYFDLPKIRELLKLPKGSGN